MVGCKWLPLLFRNVVHGLVWKEIVLQVRQNDRRAALWLCIAFAFASTPTAAQQPKPNIPFILADNVEVARTIVARSCLHNVRPIIRLP